PAGRYPAPHFHGARTFLSRWRERPSGRLALHNKVAAGAPVKGGHAIAAALQEGFSGRSHDLLHLAAIGDIGAAHPLGVMAALVAHDRAAEIAAGPLVGAGKI